MLNAILAIGYFEYTFKNGIEKSPANITWK
jgi:hypothetical protein